MPTTNVQDGLGFSGHDLLHLFLHVDGLGIQRVLEMHGVVLLDHLYACPAVLGDLVDVGTFHQAEADIGMAETIRGPLVTFTVSLEPAISHGAVELLLVVLWEHEIGRLGVVPLHQPLKRMHRARGALAVAKATLATHLDQEDALVALLVLLDGHVAVLKPISLVGPQAGVGHEQDVVMELFGGILPIETSGGFGALTGVGVELLVFLGREPGAVRDLTRCLVRGREVWKVADPAVTQGSLHDLSQSDGLMVEGTACRHLAGLRMRLEPHDTEFLYLARCDGAKRHLTEIGEEVVVDSRLVVLHVAWIAFAVGEGDIFLNELFGGVGKGALGL